MRLDFDVMPTWQASVEHRRESVLAFFGKSCSESRRDDGSIARARGMMESIFNNEMKRFNSDLRRLLFEHQQEIIDGWLR